MKNYLLKFSILLLGAAIITSCSKDDIPDNPTPPSPPVTTESGIVSLQLSNVPMGTRASFVEEPGTVGEVELADKIAVFVYSDQGSLQYYHDGVTIAPDPQQPDRMLSDTFRVSKGENYFYAFSYGHAPTPPPSAKPGETARETFEKQEIWVDFAQNVPITIAESGKMTMGTLWSGDKVDEEKGNLRSVNETGYSGDPQKLGLQIGRTAAKVTLEKVEKGASSTMQGTFDFTNLKYRMRSVPNKCYVVGQYIPAPNGFPPDQDQYISAVHEIGPALPGTNSPVYVDYLWNYAKTISESFYLVENTSQMMNWQDDTSPDKYLYYGNTTYLQFEVTYTPAATELYAPPTVAGTPPTSGASPHATGNFWLAKYTSTSGTESMLLFNEDPTGAPDIDDNSVEEYQGGVMYYKVAIRDQDKLGMERKYCVIRNHWYHVYINSINTLGKPTDEVPSITPIDDLDPTVQVSIKVEPWYRIDQNEDL